jgi:hypothetical protein
MLARRVALGVAVLIFGFAGVARAQSAVSVTVSQLNVRDAAWGNVIGSAPQDSPWVLTGNEDQGFVEVFFRGGTGWIDASYATAYTGQGVAIGIDGLNVRDGASTSADVVGQASTGQTYAFSASSGAWNEIRYDESRRWVYASYTSLVALGGAAPAPAPTPTPAPAPITPPSNNGSPLGSIVPGALPTAGTTYAVNGGSGRVSVHVGNGFLLMQSGMAIDADGSGSAWRSDPYGQPTTSLTNASGVSLDPTVTPYFVLPSGFRSAHPGVALGDVGAVIYQGQVVFAIFGDVGPSTKLGEGSTSLAVALGIPSSPTTGGVSSGVTYVVFPGSGSGTALSNAQIQSIGAACLQAAGGNP